MAELALNKKCLKLLDKLYQQISGTTIGINLPPLMHAYLWIPLLWFNCIVDIFLKHFMPQYKNSNPDTIVLTSLVKKISIS